MNRSNAIKDTFETTDAHHVVSMLYMGMLINELFNSYKQAIVFYFHSKLSFLSSFITTATYGAIYQYTLCSFWHDYNAYNNILTDN